MATEEERCAEAAKFRRIDDAFRRGDLEALRAAVDDPGSVPNGVMPVTIGSCLVYAVYHSPLAFIRTLLEIGADPNAPVDDGFPPLIAALCCTRDEPGANKRTDVDEVLRLLLRFGADPNNQRGVNDYTPLHMAVAERNLLAVQILLDAGADPDLRTRIDDYETPLEMARSAGLEPFVAMLARKGAALGQRLRYGVTLLTDVPGTGEPVRRQHVYHIRLRSWVRGEPIRWSIAWGPVNVARLEDNGETLFTDILVNRGRVISGLFYGVEGMRVGGTRRLELAPDLAYGKTGVPGVIPPNAALVAEITILEERPARR